MYIGGTGIEGLHHLLKEVVDNSIDEAMAGHCNIININLTKDGWVEVIDNGRGIPVDKHSTTGKSALETVLTVLHAGGKFGDGGYKVSGGLHGVGVSVVNALSTDLEAIVSRGGKKYYQTYKYGAAQGDIKEIEKTEDTGTIIRFKPDPSIFETIEFNYQTELDRMRQRAYLTKGVKISFRDERGEIPQSETFYFEGGIRSYVEHLNIGREAVNKPAFYLEKTEGDILVELALQYCDSFNENVRSFANNIITPEGGTHLTGFRAALTRVINDYARKNGLLKEKEDNLTGEDVREGLTAVISVKLPEPQFEGQTKSKLGTPEVRNVVENIFAQYFSYYLEENPNEAKKIIAKGALSARARLAARAARDTIIRKGALEGSALPGKLIDCRSKDPSQSEIYLVEGDSAGGTVVSARDSEFQAVLALKGKILNVERARLDKMLASQEIKNLIIAFGTGIGENYDLEKLRYHRIIIMTDADVDGSHIRTLLLTFFFRYLPQVIEKGYIYIALPPLYKISKGKEAHYAYNDRQKEEILADFASRLKSNSSDEPTNLEGKDGGDPVVSAEDLAELALGSAVDEDSDEDSEEDILSENLPKGVNIARYKGLGEMNADQLWETTMDPEIRILLKVTSQDAEAADRIFNTLMGDDVSLRKTFIQSNAKKVSNLDI